MGFSQPEGPMRPRHAVPGTGRRPSSRQSSPSRRRRGTAHDGDRHQPRAKAADSFLLAPYAAAPAGRTQRGKRGEVREQDVGARPGPPCAGPAGPIPRRSAPTSQTGGVPLGDGSASGRHRLGCERSSTARSSARKGGLGSMRDRRRNPGTVCREPASPPGDRDLAADVGGQRPSVSPDNGGGEDDIAKANKRPPGRGDPHPGDHFWLLAVSSDAGRDRMLVLVDAIRAREELRSAPRPSRAARGPAVT